MKGYCLAILYLCLIILFKACESQPLPDLPPDIETTQAFAIPVGLLRIDLKKVSNTQLPFQWFTDSILLSKIDKFEMSGSMPFDGKDQIKNLINLAKIDLHVGIYNEFPSEIAIKVYLINSNSKITDSLFIENIPKSLLRSNGTIKDTAYLKKVFEFDKKRIENLATNRSVQINLTLSKPGDKNLLKYYDNLAVNVKLGLVTVIQSSTK